MAESFISLRCPGCNTLASVPVERSGETVICRLCEREMLVPGQQKKSRIGSGDDLIGLDDDDSASIKQEPAADTTGGKAVDVEEKKDFVGNKSNDQTETTTDDGLPQLTDWSSYRRSNPRIDEPDKSATNPKTTASTESQNPESDVANDDDLGDLLTTITRPAAEPDSATGKNPFEVDPFAPLRIDGITPSDSEFSMICNVCGSLMYARLSQIGSAIKCHDCHSMVNVAAPRKRPETKGKPQPKPPLPDVRDDEGYRLEPETKLPPIDTTIDLSLGNIDYDDDEFFVRRRALESADPDIYDETWQETDSLELSESVGGAVSEASGSEAEGQDAADYALAPTEEEGNSLARSQVVFESMDELLAEYPLSAATTRTALNEDETERPITVVPVDESELDQDEHKPETIKKEPKSNAGKLPRKKRSAGSIEDIRSPFSGLGGWLASVIKIVVQPLNLARIGMGTVVLGFGYLAFFSGLANFVEEQEVETINLFGGYLLMGLGIVPIVATFLLLAVHSSSIIRDAIDQRPGKGEWPDFSIADFASQFLFMGTSFWLAAVPGIIAGQILWIVTEFVYCLPGCIVVSSVWLAPFFLSSVVFNGSPLELVSGDAFVSISRFRYRWIRYWIASFLTAVAFTGAIAGSSLGTAFAFLFPPIQLGLAIMLFWMVGDMTGYIVRLMERKGES